MCYCRARFKRSFVAPPDFKLVPFVYRTEARKILHGGLTRRCHVANAGIKRRESNPVSAEGAHGSKCATPGGDADWEEATIIVAGSNEQANKEPREHPCPCSIWGHSPLAQVGALGDMK